MERRRCVHEVGGESDAEIRRNSPTHSCLSYSPTVQKAGGIIGRHPVASYFVLTFAISWMGALAVAAPHLMRHEPLPKLTGILMFPAMLLGPYLAGITLARIVDGEDGVWDLFSRMSRWRLPARWYAALLIPPILVLAVLFLLETFASPVYAPQSFSRGHLFWCSRGLLEEIGWMGYAFPKMRSQKGALDASILLGLLWGSWHLPVINYNHSSIGGSWPIAISGYPRRHSV